MAENGEPSSSNESQTERDVIVSSQSSVGAMSFDDTLTFDSSTLQDFGSLVSLPAGTIAGLLQGQNHTDDEQEGQTIVSSQPSGADIPPPEASQDLWAISPHPGFVADSVMSLPTVDTDSVSYRTPTASDVNFTSSEWQNHDEDEYEYESAIGDDPTAALLSIVEPPKKLLPVPPAPLKNHESDSVSTEDCSYCARDYLPDHFICKLCNDVIVGALSLNCGCASSTVCSLCWEANTSPLQESGSADLKKKLNYVWVDKGEQAHPSCPSCNASIKSNINCHALDVAIFQILLNLPVKDDKVKGLKNAYYSRLEVWRCIVIERNERVACQESARRDELLARLLQEEENFFQRGTHCKSKSVTANHNGHLFFWGQAALAVVVATLASIGLRAITRR
eukprot:scaffold11043_cov122-Cylindrotheca_fusiformis.AAC.4